MSRSIHTRSVAALTATALAAGCVSLLAACSAASPESTARGLDAATERFIACLQAGGLDTRTTENGRVLVKVPIEVDADGIPEPVAPPEGEPGGEVSLEVIDGAVYQSVDDPADFADDWGIEPIYADCLAEVPDFEQASNDFGAPDDDLDPEVAAAQTELLLAFAECAREQGVTDFPDPEQGSMVVPASVDEDTLRSILDACSSDLADSEAPLSVRMEAIPDAPGGDLGRVFEDYPELTDHGLMVTVGASR
ncbi:hypothetical protein FLP10_07535 [Agromyces intestinalis]|uniref:Uncharacterized protein n=1 Tax=Agromyces intestinalis TaxID=2592652 RepID=A0A5C1YFK7_9MICO|nr:hypothetical protein [Agromyces intestinalis]QEO14285.1 hypothetical protein FLP10_07535 [Agromyces intestinalis]